MTLATGLARLSDESIVFRYSQGTRAAILAPVSESETRPDVDGLLLLRRHRQLAGPAAALPAALARARERPAGRDRPRVEPQLELRPLAARLPALAQAPAPLDGEVRALQPDPRPDPAARRRLSGPARDERPRGDRARDRARARAATSSSCSRRARAARRACARSSDRRRTPVPRGSRSSRAFRSSRPPCRGTDRLARLGPLRVAYGEPVPLDDLAEHDHGTAAKIATERLMERIAELEEELRARMRPLLVIDGDSFAHRAYHALPKSIRRADRRPAGALVGFSNMLIRLWEAEEPRTVLVAWDTLEVPTYRHQAFDVVPVGPRVRRRPARAARPPPRARRVVRLRRRQRRRVRGRRLPGRGGRRRDRARRPGAGRDLRPGRVPAGLRERDHPPADARRERDRAHRPGRGARALRRRARAGAGLHRAARRPLGQAPRRARRRARRRRRRSSPSTARSRTRSTRDGSPPRRTRSACTGRSRSSTTRLRCRRSRTAQPDWAGAAEHASRLGPGRARRAAWRRGTAHRSRKQRGDAAPPSDRAASRVGGAPAGAARVAASAGTSRGRRRRRTSRAATTAAYIERIREISGPTWLDPDTVASETSYEAALLVRRGRDRGRASRSVRARPAARPPRAPRARDGLLPVRQRRDRGAVRAGRAGRRARGDRRLGRPPRQRDAGRSSGTTRACSSSRSTSGRSIPAAGGPDEQNETTLNVPLPAGSGDDDYGAAFATKVEPAVAALRPRARHRLGRLRRARAGPARDDGSDRGRLPRARPALGRARPPRGRRARGRLQPRDASAASCTRP